MSVSHLLGLMFMNPIQQHQQQQHLRLRMWGYNDKMVSVFVVDATFVTDPAKFISGSLLALSAMISLQLPHVNVLSKCDLVEEASMDRVLEMESALQLWDVLGGGHCGAPSTSDRDVDDSIIPSSSLFIRNQLHASSSNKTTTDDAPSLSSLLLSSHSNTQQNRTSTYEARSITRERKWHRLTEAICSLLDDFSMVGFIPLNINDEDSIMHVLATVDHAIQYGEDLEVRGADYNDDIGGEGEE